MTEQGPRFQLDLWVNVGANMGVSNRKISSFATRDEQGVGG